ncbi:NAD(P)/FAD-dependent oxidoreductase [Rhodococcus sp. HNM0569]|nr:NAD(P)/FAD-dependent oxidoreductase [Rhodococcus sp. HNM0569]
MATRLARRGRDTFVVLERAADVGGTWRDNRYPGVACDVPARIYEYSFRPPGDWSSLFADGHEIARYLRDTVRDEGLAPHIRLHTEVVEARFDDEQRRWLVATTTGTVLARVLVTAVGRLSEPRLPDVDGVDEFPGSLFHSAAWDSSAPIEGAAVAVVGTGASAVQIVPQLARSARSVVVLSRTPPWIVPRGNRRYSDEERRMRRDESTARAERDDLFADADVNVRERLGPGDELEQIREKALGHLRRQVPDARLRGLLTPSYEIGCKRILLSDDFYPALGEPHVTFEPSALARIDGDAVVAASGARYTVDTVVAATGFFATDMPFAQRVVGRGGTTLAQRWSRGMTSYASTAVHGFPDMFVLDGPNAALGHNSALYMIETQIDYVLGALDTLAADPGLCLEVTEDAEAEYTREIDTRAESTVWLRGGCESWYVDPRSHRLTLLWPGTGASFRERNGRFSAAPYRQV